MRQVAIHELGRMDYDEALALQRRLVDARREGRVPDTLLLLEHEPVITLGRGTLDGHVLESESALQKRGVALRESGRGGDVTYHGPGQLVGYPIVDLSPDRRDVRRYVGNLEEVMLRVAARHGLRAGREEGLRGAWIEDRKLGAVGVRISRWITMHGFALNVSRDLSGFGLIVPCGLHDRGVTSLSRELGTSLALGTVQRQVGECFGEVFESRVEWHQFPPDL